MSYGELAWTCLEGSAERIRRGSCGLFRRAKRCNVEQSGEFLTELVCMTRLLNGASSQGRPLFVLWRLYDEEFKQASNDQTDESN
jgi:hypothetical protein